MKVCVSTEKRFVRTPDGNVWGHGPYGYSFFRRYLETFDAVQVVARVAPVAEPQPNTHRADGPYIEFCDVPYYVGLRQYLQRMRAVKRSVLRAVDDKQAVILRLPSPLAACLERTLRASRRPYAVEVVGDPWDVFSPGAFRHPLRPCLRRWFGHRLRIQCRDASAAAYVTQSTLQRRYPCPGYSVGYSSVELADEAFATKSRPPTSSKDAYTLITVGSMETTGGKGFDLLLEAVRRCTENGWNVRLKILGDGRFRGELEQLAARLGVGERVEFLGQVDAGSPVRKHLDRADLFVLPTRGEGLPRALLEAMARGLPCIASDAGGIPELLPADDLFAPGVVQPLLSKIDEVLADPARMTRMSARNLAKAREYQQDVLAQRRTAFYEHVRHVTANWLAANPQTASAESSRQCRCEGLLKPLALRQKSTAGEL